MTPARLKAALKLAKLLIKKSGSEHPTLSAEEISAQLELSYRAAEVLGVKLKKNSDPNAKYNVAWTGKVLNVKSTYSYDVLHHLAHWIVAPDKNRKLPEFGLGWGFDTGNSKRADAAKQYHEDDSEPEFQEHQASLLGILMERHLGFRDYHNTLKAHSWDMDCDLQTGRISRTRDSNMLEALDALLQRGIVTATGRVKALKSLKI